MTACLQAGNRKEAGTGGPFILLNFFFCAHTRTHTHTLAHLLHSAPCPPSPPRLADWQWTAQHAPRTSVHCCQGHRRTQSPAHRQTTAHSSCSGGRVSVFWACSVCMPPCHWLQMPKDRQAGHTLCALAHEYGCACVHAYICMYVFMTLSMLTEMSSGRRGSVSMSPIAASARHSSVYTSKQPACRNGPGSVSWHSGLELRVCNAHAVTPAAVAVCGMARSKRKRQHTALRTAGIKNNASMHVSVVAMVAKQRCLCVALARVSNRRLRQRERDGSISTGNQALLCQYRRMQGLRGRA